MPGKPCCRTPAGPKRRGRAEACRVVLLPWEDATGAARVRGCSSRSITKVSIALCSCSAFVMSAANSGSRQLTGRWARRELRKGQQPHPPHTLGQPLAVGTVAGVGEPPGLHLRHGEHLRDDRRFPAYKTRALSSTLESAPPRRGMTRVVLHRASANPGRFRRTCSLIVSPSLSEHWGTIDCRRLLGRTS